MSDARWERIKAVFAAATALPASQRQALLDRECGGDAELRREVESLLDAHTQAIVRTGGAAHELAAPNVAETPREQAGAQIGRYKLLQLIGEGGFGSVWMAEQHEPVKRRVALKIIKLGMDTRQVIARFEAERQALAMMDHPNIAKVFDAGATETGRPYFVMEYIKGVPIVEYCDSARQDTKARLELFRQVCHAIQHAHQKGIIHRDIKPSNVLITLHDGVPVPKVIDFGIAKATNSELTQKTLFTEHRHMVGTPAYMSPEQAEMSGLDIDTRSDIYSLGVLLYELLTGTTPFAHKELMSKGFAEMMRIIREVEPHKPSTRLSTLDGDSGPRTAQQRHAPDTRKLSLLLRGDLDWIVMKCLEKNRTRRYETASGLAADIKRHLNDEPVSAGPPSAAYKLRKFVKRNRGQVIAASIVTVALVLGLVGTSAGMMWALREKTKATLAADSEAAAKVAAQENEQRAITAAKAAEVAKEEEAKARKRAETINAFVTTALKASDAKSAGAVGTPNAPGFGGVTQAVHDMTILAAMDNAVIDINSGRFQDDPQTEAELRDTIGVILLNNGKYENAKPLLEQALAMRERLFKPDDPIVAHSLNNLAELYAIQGQYAQAEPLFTRALTIREETLGPDHLDVANSLNNLATLYQLKARYPQAQHHYTRALAIREKALAPDHPDLASSLNNLADVYRAQSQYSQAEPLYIRALAIREKVLGPDHAKVAQTMNELAILYQAQDRYEQAEPLHVRALAIREKALGPDHPNVAQSLNSLASLYESQGKYAQAEPLYVQSLAIKEKALGPDHPSLAISLNNLAGLYYAQAKYADAEPLWIRSLAIREKAQGPDHPSVATVLSNLSELYRGQGQYARAEPLATRSLAIREKALGPEHPSVATSLNSLALLHDDQAQYAQAEPLFARAVAIRRKTLGPDHTDLAGTLTNLARTRHRLGKTIEARQDFDEALAMLRRLSPEGSPLLARVLWRSASARLPSVPPVPPEHDNDAVAALAELEEAVAMAEKFLPPEHPHLKEYRQTLANCRAAIGK
jgi:serine/threonine protein kinase/tetratricopeptide (TPR) repeat protein